MKPVILLRRVFLSPAMAVLVLAPPVYLQLSAQLGVKPATNAQVFYFGAGAAVFMLARLIIQIALMFRGPYYDSERLSASGLVEASLPPPEISGMLAEAGYRRAAASEASIYLERFDIGLVGAALVSAGLMLGVMFHTVDKVTAYSSEILHGIGQPIGILEPNAYTRFVDSLLHGKQKRAVKLRIFAQTLPGATEDAPKGASDVALLDEDGNELLRTDIRPGKPFKYQDYTFDMVDITYTVWVVVLQGEGHIITTQWVKMPYLDEPYEGYHYYGSFTEDFNNVEGEVGWDPLHESVHLVAIRNGVNIMDMDLGIGEASTRKERGYIGKFNGYGKWSRFTITREGVEGFMKAFLVIALAGLVLRLAVRPDAAEVTPSGAGGSVVKATRPEKVRALLGNAALIHKPEGEGSGG